MKHQVDREIVTGLENICSAVSIRLNSQIYEMAYSVGSSGAPSRILHELKTAARDPSAESMYVKKVYEMLSEAKGWLEEHHGIDLIGQKHVAKKLPALLVDIVLGEALIGLMDFHKDEFTKNLGGREYDKFSKGYYDMRHGLFVREDMASSEMSAYLPALVDISRKYLANIGYCMTNTISFDTKFYSSPSCLVSVAGAHYNIVIAGLHDHAAVELCGNHIERFVLSLADAAAATQKTRAEDAIIGRIHGMCLRSSRELEEHRFEGFEEYRASIRDVESFVECRKKNRKYRGK